MPLRKQGTTIKLAAAAASVLALATVPASANAGILDSLFKRPAATTKTGTVTTTATPTTAPALEAIDDSGCTQLPTTQAFKGVDGDTADYSLAPGGDFESGTAGWSFTGSAAITSGNENLGVSKGSKSLRMPLGATATSPEFCIDESNPHFRFTYKVDNVGAAGFIAYVIYRDAAGELTKTELLSSTGLSLTPTFWQASPNSPLATIVPLNGANRSATVQVKFLATSPADLGGDIAATVLGANSGLGKLVKGATSLASSATNIGTGITSKIVNVGVTVDSLMVDPYRRG